MENSSWLDVITIFPKSFILDVWLGYKYTSAICSFVNIYQRNLWRRTSISVKSILLRYFSKKILWIYELSHTFQSLMLEHDARGKLRSAFFLIKFAMPRKMLWKLFIDLYKNFHCIVNLQNDVKKFYNRKSGNEGVHFSKASYLVDIASKLKIHKTFT